MYVTVKQKHVIETVRKKAVLKRYIMTLPVWSLIISSNFRIRELTKIGLAYASKELLETILKFRVIFPIDQFTVGAYYPSLRMNVRLKVTICIKTMSAPAPAYLVQVSCQLLVELFHSAYN